MGRRSQPDLLNPFAGVEGAIETAPVRMFLSLVRTNAPPLPGFTC